ncbi:hypothetical protein [Streptomyces cavernicola]|uniref:Peptidase M41 domain-containing protein n=1 Tax=Streptomyces cavernicola TaxID=3043613 RepID=A0ABT6SCY1_9ACTN|nr:hypothetical protein [Streptomyces sp. B-S-A6]MDI3406048.1 hypothetical protein [Streptomyces sp. B-S-A6]
MTTTPSPEALLDHAGNPRQSRATYLTYEQSRLGMAFHEAGHAVLALAYGLHVESSEVIAWTDDSSWRVTGKTFSDAPTIHVWRFAAMCAAGQVTQVNYLMAYGLWTPERALACTAEHDREMAIDVLAPEGFRIGREHVPAGGKSWSMVRGMARRKVEHLWREIRTVAHAMDENTILTGDQIAEMTGLVNPVFEAEVAA